jgi:ABC-type branched-subunit amino acid transport system substrate-binding protein
VKNRILFISLAVVLILSLSLVGCVKEEPLPITGTVYIGGSFPLTGPYPEDGAAVLAAFQNYAAYVNANHKTSPWGETFPEGVTLEVKYLDDAASPPTALTNYATLKGQGLKMFRISGSGIATAMKDTLLADNVAATTMASGPYLVTPRVGTIFSNYPIYTDQCAAIADWFFAAWNATHPGVKPRVAYLTNNSFGMTVPTAEMDAYLTKKGYEVVKPVQVLPAVPAGPGDATTALLWCKANNINLTLGAMLVAGAVPTMTEAETLGIGVGQDYEMTIGLGSPAHLLIFLRDAPAGTGDGLVVAGSYPTWSDTCDGVQFCKTLMNTYMTGGFKNTEHVMYQHGVVEAMIQVEAIRLAMLNTGKQPSDLTTADVLNQGFLKITDLDTGGIIPSKITYGIGDVEGAETVRLDQNQNGVDVLLGASYPLRHVY